MNANTYKVLEFDKIKEEIAEYCIIEENKEAIYGIVPLKDTNEIKKKLEITKDLADLKRFDGGIEIDGIRNIKEMLKKTEIIGTFLEPEEFFYIRLNMRRMRRIKNCASEFSGKYKALHFYLKDTPVYGGVEELIDKAVDDDKNIKDDASIELRELRSSKKAINESIKRKFDEIVNDPEISKALQERIVTVRDGRFVIPVKTDFKGMVKGIEHDRSSSGMTVFIEPMAVVSLNNKIRELEAREREEIRKILLRLTDVIRGNLDGIRLLDDRLMEVEYYNAVAEYSNKKKCNIPKLNEKEYVRLDKARHPLIDEAKMVPVTLEIGRKNNIMLITGPNTGGKTVTLKTVGLLTVMAMSGIPIPAEENSEIAVFTGVYADIGDEQSIAQSLSSFSAHLTNIKDILDNVTKNSLVLLDEIGSGTDPIEGAALAIAIIDYLKDKKTKVIATTHYSEVKAYGFNNDEIESASMEFDVATLAPTYRLLVGIPGRSNALIIADKLGIPKGIIDEAQSRISEENKEFEGMIKDIKEKTDEVDKIKESLLVKESEIEKLKSEFADKVANLEKEKNRIIEEAYKKAEEVVKNMQNKAKALVDRIQTEEVKKEEAKEAQKSLNMLMKALSDEKVQEVKKEVKSEKKIDFTIGEKVTIKSLNREGIILKIIKEKGEIQVQAGVLKLVIGVDDLEKIQSKKHGNHVSSATVKRYNVRNEIDLRGKNIDESIYDLDKYLDGAVLTGFSEVFIIHGKGTGKLREGIQEYLKDNRYVKEYRDGNINEGGLGCTVVKLK